MASEPNGVKRIGTRFVRFSDMTWPLYDEDLAWRLLHAPESVTPKEYVYIASLMCAYRELINCGRVKRDAVTKQLREAVTTKAQDAEVNP
jgi:hypothetical protein